MPRSSFAKLGVLVTAILASGFGCELISQVDRSQISDAGGTGGVQTTSSTSSTVASTTVTTGSTGGAGGSGGMGSTSSSGGTGGSAPCTTAVDCPDPGNECLDRACPAGQCAPTPKSAGTLATAQTAGDCLKSQCDGSGKIESVKDDNDLPVDGLECTDDVCNGGVASNPPKAASAACGMNGALFCDGAGKCVGCNVAGDCAGADTECQTHTCTAGACGVVNAAQGAVVAAQTAGDCHKAQCDGAGAVESIIDNADLPVDSETCTQDVCTAGVPTNPPVAVGAVCAEGSGILCDGAGKCAACLVATDCGGVDTECQQRACIAGVCGMQFSPQGIALSAQTASDCKKAVCDGSGGITTQTDDTDLPNDNNACTTDVCTSGVASHGTVANGASCGGSLTCLNGTCAGCAQPSDCPGVDDECKARSCTVGVCGFNFTASGFAVAAQTAGDCHKKQCDGAGNITSNIDNTDVPVDDGQQCTSEICTAGVPSHPAAAANTACNQAGGSFCSAAGTCVQCNAAAQCSGTDTECHTRTCTANACGVNNTAAGFVTAAQATGDCHKNQCDGAGNIVNNVDNADVPADDGQQCTSEICTAGVPSHPAVAVNTACSQAGGTVCSAGGACVQCNASTQCPGTDTECHARTCTANACGVNNTAAGFVTAAQTVGDCLRNQCDGAGNIVPATDTVDVPVDDGNQCTGETCVGATPSHPNLAPGVACNQGGGTLCNGSGACVSATCSDGAKNGSETGIDCGGGTCPSCALGLTCIANADCQSGACAGGVCVQCITAATCPGTDTECHTRTCNANVCGANNAAAGTATSAQTTGDCHQNQCDGAGNIVNTVANGDTPVDDGNQCTSEICTAGVPSHPTQPVDTACSQAGGTVCSAGGACVQCNAATQCPGTDTECHTRTCSGNTCGANNAAAGTLTVAQTASDCHTNQCDGAGNIVNNVDNNDTPVDDGNQCTTEVCTAGVPSHPTVPVNTACSQGGGTVCSAGGTCVQCNAAAQCGTNTECQTFTCTANACGTNNVPAGTLTAAQTTGDCHTNQCDGLGAIVPAIDNSDVPNDSNQCTGDVCTAGVPSNPSVAVNTACSQNGGTICDGNGSCVSAPQVASTSPSDATTPIAAPAIAVTFTTAMNPATLTGQTTAGACSGSIQVSLDSFASCVAFSSALATMSGGNTTATFTTTPGLLVNWIYKIRVTTAAASATGIALPAQFTLASGFTTVTPNLGQGSVVVSQFFGGGGASATVPNADYVELHNRGTTAVTMTNWSLQYASAAGNTWQVLSFSGTVQPSSYFLVRMQNVQATGTALPAIDASGTGINISQSAGKIALVSNITALTGACPTGAAIVDFVGYGAQVLATGCWEGVTTAVSTAAAPSATTADFRVQSGCADVNNNTSDFTTAAPAPRNSATAAVACACSVLNELSLAAEADYVDVQFPNTLSPAAAGATTATVYGRIKELGVTDLSASASTNVRAQIGYGPATSNPEYEAGWTWTNATFNAAFSDPTYDEYQATFTAPATGTYRYVYRFSLDQGVSWTYADTTLGDGGAGQDTIPNTFTFDFANEGVMTVP
jgi:hypothetical protein